VRVLAIAAAWLAVLFALLAAGGGRRDTPMVAEATAARLRLPSAPGTAPIVPAAPQRAPRADYVLATSSLRGSAVDGGVMLDGGRVVPDRELRRLFDWWLSLDGELAPAAIRSELAQWLAERHDPGAAQRVLDLFDRYLQYRAAVAGIDATLPLEERLARLHELRLAWLGRELADAFFADEEREAAQALERRRVAGDALLTRDERTARIAALDATLPAPERAAREAELEPWLVEAQTRALAGASDVERRRERSALWGNAAAQRLAALDAQRSDWAARVAAYRRERDALLASTAPAHQQVVLTELRARRFAPHEARRVESLEAIDALPEG
jgi:lipase chaperone LimK